MTTSLITPNLSPLHKLPSLTIASSCSSSGDKKLLPVPQEHPPVPQDAIPSLSEPLTPRLPPVSQDPFPDLPDYLLYPRTYFLVPQHYHMLQGLSSPSGSSQVF